MNKNNQQNISPFLKSIPTGKKVVEKVTEYFFKLNGFIASIFILLIFYFLLKEALNAFEFINIKDFVYSTENGTDSQKVFEWYPTSGDPKYSIIPLFLGSLLTALPATLISTFFGVIIGIYLSEIASKKAREILKPVIELFAGIPTVVLGFFMLAVGATLLHDLVDPVNRLNAFLAALGLSCIVIPIIASLTEDALRNVPNETRMASYALGATKWQTIRKVVVPSAINGITAGVIIGFGRAIGETMIVLMASGNAAVITVDVFNSVRTISATIAAEMGEVSQGSAHYFALFFIGIVLFSFTFLLNLIVDLTFYKSKKRIRY